MKSTLLVLFCASACVRGAFEAPPPTPLEGTLWPGAGGGLLGPTCFATDKAAGAAVTAVIDAACEGAGDYDIVQAEDGTQCYYASFSCAGDTRWYAI